MKWTTLIIPPLKGSHMSVLDPPPQTEPVLRRADLLLVLPFIWQLGLAPWANDVTWKPYGLPFPMAWQMSGIMFTTLALALRYRLGLRMGEQG